MKPGPAGSFGARLKALREAAGYTQEELATIAGLSVHAVSALERGERRRPHVETVRALSAALDLSGPSRDALLASARAPVHATVVDDLSHVSLPLALTGLLGRDADVKALRDLLADPAARLVTLIGPGGVGKTRLALELGRAIAEEASVRMRFVPLAALRDPEFVAPAIAEALGLSDVTALDLPRRARAACADRRTLMVLDNFEHLLPAAPLVAELLTSVRSLGVLVTSRAPLHIRGEREYLVGPLRLPGSSESSSLADLARVPAVRLFVERVRDVDGHFRLTQANGPTVTAICRRLDALPLALELAAPWVKVLTLDVLLHRLEHNRLLETVSRDLPERQQTMNATVAWSYQLLDPDEQRAFRRLSVLPGLFSVDAAEAVLTGPHDSHGSGTDALRLVSSLIDKSLLQRAEATVVATRPLYLMLDTMRAYAAHELDAAGERDDARGGLARYCACEASLAATGLVGPAQVQWLERVHEDLESYRAVLAWLIARGRSTEASEIGWRLWYFWLIRGHGNEGLRWYEQILSLPSLPPAAESRALVGAAAMCYTQGAASRARTALTRAMQLAHHSEDREMLVHAELLSGLVEHATGSLDVARDRFAHSVEGFQALATPWGVGNALGGMASVALATGDAEHAERLLDQATAALRKAGPWFLLWPLYLRAILAVRRGNSDEAIGFVRQSLTRIRDLQDKVGLLAALIPLAGAAVLKGDYAWAARILGARDAVMERTGITLVEPPVRDLREQAEHEARARLGPDQWARAYAAGRTMSIHALLKDIDGVLLRGAPLD
jgi:predicted ATPase/DNA-binding XRE family transcriptional regulator